MAKSGSLITPTLFSYRDGVRLFKPSLFFWRRGSHLITYLTLNRTDNTHLVTSHAIYLGWEKMTPWEYPGAPVRVRCGKVEHWEISQHSLSHGVSHYLRVQRATICAVRRELVSSWYHTDRLGQGRQGLWALKMSCRLHPDFFRESDWSQTNKLWFCKVGIWSTEA